MHHALDASNSASMKRNPAPKEDLVRGKASYMPFLPGGLDPADLILKPHVHLDDDYLPIHTTELLTVPPGMERGLIFKDSVSDQKTFNTIDNVIDLDLNNDFLKDLLQEELSDQKESSDIEVKGQEKCSALESNIEALAIDELIPVLVRYTFFKIKPDISNVLRSQVGKQSQNEWVKLIDVSAEFPDFETLVPDMAIQFPFELDVFQKRAVYHLENSESVFIAAHTSAGKTGI